MAGVVLVLALGLRVVGLDRRPMHHDEANQAVKFGALLETGEYRYDPSDHHGPTLYYLTLPAAWARGQRSLAALDEWTVRIVPALFGIGLLLAFVTLAGRLGRAAVAVAMLLAAVSPALVYFSRFYIQESMFAFLAIACLIAMGRYVEHPTLGAAVGSGVCVGLAYATKETSIIVVPAAMAAVAVAHHWPGPGGRRLAARMMDERGGPPIRHLAAGAGAALVVAWLFFTSFLSHPDGFVDSIRAFGAFVERGTGASLHRQPWHYYLSLLGWSSSGGVVWTEAAVLALAAAGLVVALGKAGTLWSRAIAIYTVITLLAFSALAYKTPWNLLPFYAGAVLLAGIGAQALTQWGQTPLQWGQTPSRPVDPLTGQVPRRERRPRNLTPKAVVWALVLVSCTLLGWQSWRAIGRYAADPRNPYVYAQTSPDFLRLVQRITELSAVHEDRQHMLVRVVAGPYEQWPLPWYLRRMDRVGYWERSEEAGPFEGTPVVITSEENAGTVESALGDRYVAEMYALRPEVFLTVFIERSLWDRYLASRRQGQAPG